jgi:hypothetical protein
MKKLLAVLLFCALAACSTATVEPVSAPLLTQPLRLEEPAAEVGEFTVEAWVDNPEPSSGERINISGSLRRNGLYLGGMMMSGFWPDEDDDRLPDCHIQVIYQRGICTVYADDFPVGEYIPVKVSFEYFGNTYSGETGFTRKE